MKRALIFERHPTASSGGGGGGGGGEEDEGGIVIPDLIGSWEARRVGVMADGDFENPVIYNFDEFSAPYASPQSGFIRVEPLYLNTGTNNIFKATMDLVAVGTLNKRAVAGSFISGFQIRLKYPFASDWESFGSDIGSLGVGNAQPFSFSKQLEIESNSSFWDYGFEFEFQQQWTGGDLRTDVVYISWQTVTTINHYYAG